MKQHPAAWIPFSRAAADLLKLAQGLRLVPMDTTEGDVAKLPDGRQSIRIDSASDNDNFPTEIIDGDLYLPPLYIDFFDWLYEPAQVIGGVPASGTYWLRMVIAATATATDAINSTYPIDVSLNGAYPIFEWHLESLGTPTEEAGIPAGNEREYYWYLVKTIDGEISTTYGQTLLASSIPFLAV